jgi:hypothetical protein
MNNIPKICSDYRISGGQKEIIIPSLFIPNDYKMHMSINLDTGLWRCFKTGKKGNIVYLYAHINKLPYRKAWEEFVFQEFLSEGVKKVNNVIEPVEDIPRMEKLDITKHTKEVVYLENRGFDKLSDSNYFYVSKEPKFKNRIVLPFFKEDGTPFFFQARSMDNREPRYLNGKMYKASEVLYPFDTLSESVLYVTEGVFDAISLRYLGFNSTSILGCFLSRAQMHQLRWYEGEIIFAFDNDKAGLEGLYNALRLANEFKMNNCRFATLPKGIKDYNEILKIGKDGNPRFGDVKIRNLDSLELAQYDLSFNLQ